MARSRVKKYKEIMQEKWRAEKESARERGEIVDLPYSELTEKEKSMPKEVYTYTYERKKNDVNGNPRHYVSIYRMKGNIPHALQGVKEDVGYRDPKQAIEDVIAEKHGWKEHYRYGSGYSENKARRLRRLGKIILHEVG